MQETIIQIMHIENTLEEKIIVIYFVCKNTNPLLNYLLKNLKKMSWCRNHNSLNKNYPLVKVPSDRQVFRWINAKIWTIKRKNCLRRKYVKWKRRKIGMYSKINNKYCIPYVLRPKKINNRDEFGHWEADLIISKIEFEYHHLLTLVEHKTKKIILRKIKDKNSKLMIAKIYNLFKK